MARPRLHTHDDLLDVAERIVTGGEPAGLTLRGLAAETGASNGTIYHAFGSKDELLAQLWLRSWARLESVITASAEAAVASGADAVDIVVAAAGAPVEFVRKYPESGRLFFVQRRDQLFGAAMPPSVQDEYNAVQGRLLDLLAQLADGVWGRRDAYAIDAIATCIVDLPSGLMRRRLVAGNGPSRATAARLEAAVRAVLAVPLAPPREVPPATS